MNAQIDNIFKDWRVSWIVNGIVRDMVHAVELSDAQNSRIHAEYCMTSCENILQILRAKLKESEKQNKCLKSLLIVQKDQARELREDFVDEIGKFINANKKLYKRMNSEKLLHHPENVVLEKRSESLPVNIIKNNPQLEIKHCDNSAIANSNPIILPAKMVKSTTKKRKAHFNLFLRLSEPQLLEVYSFLQTMEVVNAAQVCRAVFARVDSLFGMESSIVRRPEWEREATEMMRELEDIEREEKNGYIDGKEVPESREHPPITSATSTVVTTTTNASTPSPAAFPSISSSSSASFSMSMPSFSLSSPSAALSSDSSGGAGKLSINREMVEALTKKLNPQELKYVLSISEQLKKRQQQIDILEADKIKLQESLKSAESESALFYDKLKSAEKALKKSMQEEANGRQQAAADQEIISFLDLRVQSLEIEKQEGQLRCQYLQASLELQNGAQAESEERLVLQLAEERRRADELEKEGRRQRRVLSKEVRALRAQLQSAHTDNARMAAKLDTLRSII